MQALGTVGVRIPKTNLIIHNCIVNIPSKATKFIRILDIVEESGDFALVYQRF